MRMNTKFTNQLHAASRYLFIFIFTLGVLASCNNKAQQKEEPKSDLADKVEILSSGFIYEEAPFPECHASSIVDLEDGRLMATWFGGTREKNPDVCIWTSTFENGQWTSIKQVADGIQDESLRYPCWNPVLFKHSTGTLYLFFKVGPNPREWWGEQIMSEDNGKTWSNPVKLPDGQLGPIRAKPIELANGNLLCPSSEEFTDGPWKVHMELFDVQANTWEKIPVDHKSTFNAIQPTLLRHGDTNLQILCRSQENKVVESWSQDNGKTWGELKATSLPNPSAGIDGVTLEDGRHLLVYNPTEDGKNDRAKLNLAISNDGVAWNDILKLEDQPTGEFSYPAIIKLPNGDLSITYTWNREKIKHLNIQLN